MKIIDVIPHVTQLGGSWLTESVISNPMSQYPKYWEKRSSWYHQQSCAVIEIVLEDQTRGYGFVGGAKGSAVPVLLEEQIKPLILGCSVFDTELIQGQPLLAHLSSRIPLGRIGEATDIADVIAFLCSDESRYMNGSEVLIDGGMFVNLL
jgi:hypothetical protein